MLALGKKLKGSNRMLSKQAHQSSSEQKQQEIERNGSVDDDEKATASFFYGGESVNLNNSASNSSSSGYNSHIGKDFSTKHQSADVVGQQQTLSNSAATLRRQRYAATSHRDNNRLLGGCNAMGAPPLVPMMIDDDGLDADDGRDLIDDDMEDFEGDDNNNNLSGGGQLQLAYRPQHGQHHRHQRSHHNSYQASLSQPSSLHYHCVDSPDDSYHQHHHHHNHLALEAPDSSSGYLQQAEQLDHCSLPPQISQQQRQINGHHNQHHHHHQRLTYIPGNLQTISSFGGPTTNANTINHKYSLHYPAIYHQPKLNQLNSHQQLNHYRPALEAQQVQYSYHSSTTNNGSFDLSPQEYSSSASGSNKAPFNLQASQVTGGSEAAAKKMQAPNRQQYPNSPASHHHHHHSQLTNNSKRKSPSSRSSQKSRSKKSSVAKLSNKPTLGCCGKLAKLFLFISNILFWSAGIALGAWGILSLVDDHKYSLSQLLVFEPNSRMSLFQLLSWSFITLGCATVLVGLCGCSAIFKNNRWILGLYIFLILAIFALDLATGLLAIIFQERLVANVRLRLVNKLRSEYGVQASFTAAIDYIQTKYECCGLEGHFDYDQSLWRLQRLGGFEATVARTCCHLRNTFDDQAHINPRPINESMCQSTDVRFHQSYRYRKGCLDDLERLVRHKIWTFTLGCGAVGAIILLSLLFATCFCRSIPSKRSRDEEESPTSRTDQQAASNHHEKKQGLSATSGGAQHQLQQQQQQQRHYR